MRKFFEDVPILRNNLWLNNDNKERQTASWTTEKVATVESECFGVFFAKTFLLTFSSSSNKEILRILPNFLFNRFVDLFETKHLLETSQNFS